MMRRSATIILVLTSWGDGIRRLKLSGNCYLHLVIISATVTFLRLLCGVSHDPLLAVKSYN